MTYGCGSGNFSSQSCGGHLQYPHTSCVSSYSSNLGHSTNLCSSGNYHLGSSHYSVGCPQNFFQPIRCQTSHVVHRPCQRSCYQPRASRFCSPWQPSSLDFGSRSCNSLDCESRSSQSLSCGSGGFRPHGISSVGYGSGFCRPSQLPAAQSSCYRPSSFSSGCGSSGFRPQGFSSLGYGSGICRPSHCNTSCFRPSCGSGSQFCGSSY